MLNFPYANQSAEFPFEMLPFNFEEEFDEAEFGDEAWFGEMQGEEEGRFRPRMRTGGFGGFGRTQGRRPPIRRVLSKNRFPAQPARRRRRRPRFPWGLPVTMLRDRYDLGYPGQDQPPDPAGTSERGGEFVRWVQSALNQILNLNLPVNGMMDVQTRSAVRSFQEKNSLPADGVVGPDTQQALQSARSGQGAGSSPVEAAGTAGVNGSSSPNGNGKTAAEPEPASEFEAQYFETDESELEDEWWDWLRSKLGFGSGQTAAGTTSPAVTQTYQQTAQSFKLSALRSNIIKIAKVEWSRWNSGGKKFERDTQMRSILQDYWQTGVGLKVNPADLGSTTWQNTYPWSAAFISWVLRKAGAGSDFAYSASHAVYTKAAKENRLARNANPFKAYRIHEAKPQPGDIVCKSRAGSGATYENIAPGMSTHCDIVVDVQPGKLTTIGGNLSDSVSTSTVTTDANGYINAKDYFAVIKLGSTMP